MGVRRSLVACVLVSACSAGCVEGCYNCPPDYCAQQDCYAAIKIVLPSAEAGHPSVVGARFSRMGVALPAQCYAAASEPCYGYTVEGTSVGDILDIEADGYVPGYFIVGDDSPDGPCVCCLQHPQPGGGTVWLSPADGGVGDGSDARTVVDSGGD